MIESWLQDFRHAARGLLANPTFSAVAILTLALSIGATTLLFTVVEAVVLRPLPFHDPGRLVSISLTSDGRDEHVADSPDITAWQARARTVKLVTPFSASAAALSGAGEPVELRGALVGGHFFDLLGAQPALGRTIRPEDVVAGAPRVVVLSHTLWVSRFGGDSSIVGRTITLDNKASQVIGVLQPERAYPIRSEYWAPLVTPSTSNGVVWYYSALARLAPGATLSTAQVELASIVSQVDALRPATQRGSGVAVMTLHDRMYGSVRGALLMLLAAVGFLLLIGCANVTNLMLARSAAREREIAVRLALGVSRARLLRQLLAESLLIAAIGASVGLLVPLWTIGGFIRLAPTVVSGAAPTQLTATTLWIAALAALIVGVCCGVVPAWSALRQTDMRSLHEGGARSTGSLHQRHLRQWLVAGELAIALILLTGAGLFARSFTRLANVATGFAPQHLATATISLPRSRYPNDRSQTDFFNAVATSLRQLPAVDQVALGEGGPTGMVGTFELRPRPGQPGIRVAFSTIGREFRSTTGMQLLAGRDFSPDDRPGSPRVLLLSESAAAALYPQIQAIGKTLAVPNDSGGLDQFTIAGVVRDVRVPGSDAMAWPHLYFDRDQVGGGNYTVIVRTHGDPAQVEPAIRSAVAALDPRQPLASFESLPQTMAKSIAPQRLNFLVVGAFALLAVMLAGVGLWGVIGYQVTQRHREMGIRVALGATTGSVQRLILREGLSLALVGCAVGIGGSLLLSRSVAGFLYGVTARDPVAFIAAPLLLLAICAVACYLPARRATRVDPAVVLRE